MSWNFQNLLQPSNPYDGQDESHALPRTRNGDQNPNAVKQDLDSILAEAVLNMSLDSRNKALEEINGIPQRNSENPVQIESGLRDLESYIQSTKSGTAYEVAEAMDRSFVSNRDFRLMFLRTARYDPKAAADRTIKFLDLKRHLFGPAKLVKKITLEDLDDDDMEYLKSGATHILPQRDSAGRPILIALSIIRNFKIENEFRARFYIAMTLAESEETQLSGITVVFHRLREFHKRKSSHGNAMLWSMPFHMASIHVCFGHFISYIQKSCVIYAAPSYFRQRLRIHYASSYERAGEILSDFGIPSNLLPVSAESFPALEFHMAWLEWRRKLESRRKSSVSVSPSAKKATTSGSGGGFTDKDVLFGYYRNHEGNMYLRKLVSKTADTYEAADKIGKYEITNSIVSKIWSGHGRFVKRDGNGEWIEVSLLESRLKVAHTFRNFRRCK